MRFDFGESYFRSISVIRSGGEKMPVSITLGPLVDPDCLSDLDSAGHQQGGARRLAL